MDAADVTALRMHSHALWSPLPVGAGGIVGHFTAMQAQEYPYALWATAQRRQAGPEGNGAADLADAVDRGEILRTHVLRPTWHFLAPADARWLLGLTAPHVHRSNKAYYAKFGLDGAVLSQVHRVLEAELAGGRHRTRGQLQQALASAGIEASGIRLSYALMHAELEELIISGASQGKQRSHALFDERVPASAPMDRDEALKRLAERYLATRGAATLKDFAVWSGLPMADARAGVAAAVEDSPGRFVLREVQGMQLWCQGQAAPLPAPPAPRVDLAQCYDEYVMSYFESKHLLFTPARLRVEPGATFYHPVLIDGLMAGTWKHVPSATAARVQVAPLRALGHQERLSVEAAAAQFGAFWGLPATVEWF